MSRSRLGITPGDVGRRVTIRWRDDDGRPTDVVGELEAWDDAGLHVRRRDGRRQSVATARVIAARVVSSPARPHRGGTG